MRAASPVGRASLTAIGPITASIASRVAPPGRSRVGVAPVRSSTVDSTPTRQGPPSRISGTRSPSDSATCSARVGLTAPLRLAEGAAIGRPAARISACATGWDGARIATVSSPAVASREIGEPSLRGSTSVSGPGQKRAASLSAVSFQRTKRCASSASSTWLISGLNCGPALGLEDRRDRALVGGVAAQAVDRLGREGDELAVAQQPRRLGDRLRRRRDELHRAALLRAMKCGLEKRGLP